MILYFGNILSKHGYTPTFIETLGPKLGETYIVKLSSDKENIILRMADMVLLFLSNVHSAKVILIDSYSKKAFWYTFILALLSRLFRIKYIPIIRGGDYPTRLVKSKKLCDFIFFNAYQNVSPSLYLEAVFSKNGYPVIYIPNFVPIEDYPFKLRETAAPNLLWVRSFHKVYNPSLAIDVLENLLKKFSNAKLCMVGPDKDGSLVKVKKYAEAKGINKQVEFTGKLSKKQWIALSTSYSIFINTTNFDNHPVSLIEAMALGLPVISTNVGGIPYLIKYNNNGILVEPGSANLFVDQIVDLIDHPKRVESISLNARRNVEKFDWDQVKLKWENLINGAI